jgi:hypothetical protein
LLVCERASIGRTNEAQMLDTVMLVLGTGAFALFLGYVAVCDRL